MAKKQKTQCTAFFTARRDYHLIKLINPAMLYHTHPVLTGWSASAYEKWD
jgi:hypothetical protein